METTFFKATTSPEEAVKLVAYPGQLPKMRQVQFGYGHYLDQLPVLVASDPDLNAKVEMTKTVMNRLAKELEVSPWIYNNMPEPHDFNRTIIAMEEPETICNGMPNGKIVTKEGVELIVAKWGDHHTSPVHGHSDGYIHEHILYGKMRVNTYRIMDAENRIVRPLRTDIAKNGAFASTYMVNKYGINRSNLVHNFVSIGQSATLHFVPEHTRDGRDNKFSVEHFEDNYNMTMDDVTRITSKDGLYLKRGEVVMVRSSNVPEYGDHFIVITGHPVVKEHGMRPQDVAIQASPNSYSMLDFFDMEMGLTLLKLSKNARQAFHDFHGITIDNNGDVIFPEA